MATGQRRTRPFSLDGRRFRWRCEFTFPAEMFSRGFAEASWTADALVIRPEDGPHRRLTVTWPACKGPLVTPGLVRACIEEALRRGWLTESSAMELDGADVPAGGRAATWPLHQLGVFALDGSAWNGLPFDRV
jgi:hypothetical protein